MKIDLPKLVVTAFVELPGSWLVLLSVIHVFFHFYSDLLHQLRLVRVQSADQVNVDSYQVLI